MVVVKGCRSLLPSPFPPSPSLALPPFTGPLPPTGGAAATSTCRSQYDTATTVRPECVRACVSGGCCSGCPGGSWGDNDRNGDAANGGRGRGGTHDGCVVIIPGRTSAVAGGEAEAAQRHRHKRVGPYARDEAAQNTSSCTDGRFVAIILLPCGQQASGNRHCRCRRRIGLRCQPACRGRGCPRKPASVPSRSQ